MQKPLVIGKRKMTTIEIVAISLKNLSSGGSVVPLAKHSHGMDRQRGSSKCVMVVQSKAQEMASAASLLMV